MSRRPPRTVIADDHAAFRNALPSALAETVEIVGQASTGHHAVALALEQRAELVILDLTMPELNGIEAASRIADLVPEARIVMFSLNFGKPYLLAAVAAGVRGFVAKEDGLDDLKRAVEESAAGRFFMSRSVGAELRSLDSAMFSQEAISEILSTFDREAPIVLDCASAITAEVSGPREALIQSFLAYAMARTASAPPGNVQRWVLLSAITYLFDRREAPVSALKTSFRPAGIFSQWATRLLAHPTQQMLRSYWKSSERERSASNLHTHLRNCPACHLEWGLSAMESIRESGNAAARNSSSAALGWARSGVESTLRSGAFESLASAWSDREKRIRRVMSSEVAILIGEGAGREWALGASSASLAQTPFVWAKQFLGGAAQG